MNALHYSLFFESNSVGSADFAERYGAGIRLHFLSPPAGSLRSGSLAEARRTSYSFPCQNGVFDVSIDDCKGPHNARLCEEGWNAVKAFCKWLKKDAPQRRIAALRPRAATRKEWIGLPESLEMQNTIAALGRLRRKSMRFDVLHDKALSLGGLLP